MNEGVVQIYYGEGHGKSTAAFGSAVRAAFDEREAIIIQFLKGKGEAEKPFLTRLEPEIKCFNFAKAEVRFEELDEAGRQEEVMNLINGFNYAKKVISTGACSLVVLDEVLGLLDREVIAIDDFIEMLKGRPEDMTIICTGRVLDDRIRPYADEIYNIAPEK